jgi:hypothetical protein
VKAHNLRIRALRGLVAAGCVAALVVPAGASAMLPKSDAAADSASQPAIPATSGARLDHRGLKDSQPYTLPAGFRTDVQSSPQGTQPYTLPASFRTDIQSSPHSRTPNSAPSAVVVRTVTVSDKSDHTLAIVLASCAVAIALCGTAYFGIRLTRLQRSLV